MPTVQTKLVFFFHSGKMDLVEFGLFMFTLPICKQTAHEQKSHVPTRSCFIEQSIDNLSVQNICLHGRPFWHRQLLKYCSPLARWMRLKEQTLQSSKNCTPNIFAVQIPFKVASIHSWGCRAFPAVSSQLNAADKERPKQASEGNAVGDLSAKERK